MDEFYVFLKQVCADPEQELEWVDLLSQMEYVGFRKIVKGVSFDRVSFSVLRHVHEESLHAYLLKAIVDKTYPGRNWRDGKFAVAGWTYFQKMDAEISALGDAALAYPSVSWGIERRVLELYPRYLEMTINPDVRRAVRRILAQEKRHGALFEETLFPEGHREKIAQIEARLWSAFLSEVI